MQPTKLLISKDQAPGKITIIV